MKFVFDNEDKEQTQNMSDWSMNPEHMLSFYSAVHLL